MWEPGAFAMMIICAIAYHWSRTGFKLDRKFFIYFAAIITTFSTAGYFACFLLIYAFYVKKFSVPNVLGLFIVTYLFISYVYNLEFMSGKVDSYIAAIDDNRLYYNEYLHAIKVNRIQIIFYDLQRVLKYPFGYGANYKSDIIAVNGLSSLLVTWGIPVFIFMMILLKKYINLISIKPISQRTKYVVLIAILTMFFSNPINRNVIAYLIFLTPLVISEPIGKRSNK